MSARETNARVEPQHNIGRGWQLCEPHQAQAWAALIGARLVGRYGNKAIATNALATALLRKQPPKRKYSFGARMEPMPEGVSSIASSLTREQYDQLKKGEQQ